jgi:hypothetical protein
MFTQNESGTDRIIRVVLGIAMLALGWLNILPGFWGTLFQWLGFIPLLTGIFGWCPLYSLLHISTRSEVRT